MAVHLQTALLCPRPHVPIHVGMFIRQIDSGTRMPLINTPGVDAALSVHPMYRVAVASGA